MFKAVFGEPRHARGALRAVLPPAVARAVDWRTLARRPGSFVDPELRKRHTDLLFAIGLRGGGEALVYLLLEHQSSPRRDMGYRLLRYLVRIWEQWQRDHPQSASLPAIVPIVLYHGRAPWSAPRAFEQLLDLPGEVLDGVRAFVPSFTYLVDDLSAIPDGQLRARATTAVGRLAAVCLKHARDHDDIVALLAEWAALVREVMRAPRGLDALALLLRYIIEVSDSVDPDALHAFLEQQLGPEAKEIAVTYGQQLIQQGIEQGIEQGERRLLLRLLRVRFGDAVDAAAERRVTAAEDAQLRAWADRVLSAATLADVLDS